MGADVKDAADVARMAKLSFVTLAGKVVEESNGSRSWSYHLANTPTNHLDQSDGKHNGSIRQEVSKSITVSHWKEFLPLSLFTSTSLR